jgi:hypothetical protein
MTLAAKYKVCASCDKRIQIDDATCWNCGSVDFKPLPGAPPAMTKAADNDSVSAQLDALAGEFQQWFTQKEIEHLPEILHPGERIKALTSGRYRGNTWLITVTDQRIVFLDKGLVFGLQQFDLPLHQISSISHQSGLVFGELHIATSSEHCIVERIAKGEVARVSAIISALVREAHAPAAANAPGPSAAPRPVDVATQIERLAALMEKGLLTKEEFEAQKAKLLS